MKFNESQIPQMYQQSMKAVNLDWEPVDTYCIYDALILSISEFLGDAKNKKEKVALSILDLKGNFRLGGIVQYHPNENEEMPGNWSYVLTFDQEDLKDCKVYDSNDIYFQRFISNVYYKKHGFQFQEFSFIQVMVIACINVLIDWLDKNASVTEVVEIELEGSFKAAVSVVNGIKEFSLTPDGTMKRLIKGDAELN